ncbi:MULTISPECIES: DUF4230 domain-containing protein [unclassified Embleya]|uniref:DUF4230 domain-containing protein n=1 Tax=unclassified Embleya TaxID=2699296 RepID=UPI0033E1DA27
MTDVKERPIRGQGAFRSARRRLGLPAFLVTLLVGFIVLALVLVGLVNLLPGKFNPFGETTKDHSGPVMLKAVQDLSRYEAVSGTFQVVVDLEKDAKFLPDAVRGQRTLFVGVGQVGGFVEFGGIGQDAIRTSPQDKSVTIRLPHARLAPAALDQKNSHVIAQDRGLFDRMGDFFSGNPGDQQQLYVLATKKIDDAAKTAGLVERAERNTTGMLQGMMRSLGYPTTTVTYA